MKFLIPRDEYGIFADANDVARVDSLFVAQFFEKEHRTVLRDVRSLDCSDDFRLHNFVQSTYKNSQGKKQPCYYMTRDGFVFLAMGYTGKKAAHFKELYIKRFNAMESFIKTLVNARQQFPKLTAQIKMLHENPRPYHFSNECDLLNRLVLGVSAKQFRLAHHIEKGKSIRPYLTDWQIEQLDHLQTIDIGLLVAVADFDQRKRLLEWSLTKLHEQVKGGGNACVTTE